MTAPPATAHSVQKPTRSASAITTVLALSGTLVALMQTLVVPLLPDFPRILSVTPDDASWLVTATLLASAVATPIVSRSADMYGKRKMMVICLAIMVAGSVMAALGGTFLWLIIGRALQGFSASLIPVGISIMRDELPKEKMGSAVALMSATLGIGSAMGLPLAGVLYESLGWTSIFWVSAAAGALLLLAVVLVVPESKVRTPGRFDYAGALVLSTALGSLLLAISKGGAWGWGSEPVLLLFLAAALLLAVWIPYELRVGQPMVDLRTTARRPVLMTNLASLLIGFAMFANMLLTTQQLQLPAATGYGFELNVITAGLCMVPVRTGHGGVRTGVRRHHPALRRQVRPVGRRRSDDRRVRGPGLLLRLHHLGDHWFHRGERRHGHRVCRHANADHECRPDHETASANGLNSLVRSIGTSTSSAAVAAVLTSVTIPLGTARLPSFDAFRDVFWMAALASAASVLAAIFIPARHQRTAPQPPAAAELVVQGRVLAPDHRPLTPAVVTVLQTGGEPVDWSRVDTDGNYSVALPGAGKYLVVANAAGWAPMAEVFDFDGRTLKQNFLLQERLEIRGRAAIGREPVTGAVVTLLHATGEHVDTARTDDDGVYTLPLPAAGRYIVAMLHPVTHQAVARKLAVDNRSVTVDLSCRPLQ